MIHHFLYCHFQLYIDKENSHIKFITITDGYSFSFFSAVKICNTKSQELCLEIIQINKNNTKILI